MPKISAALNDEQVAVLGAGQHSVGGVKGLFLYVDRKGKREWSLKVRSGKDVRRFHLGVYPEVSLAQARRKAKVQRDRTLAEFLKLYGEGIGRERPSNYQSKAAQAQAAAPAVGSDTRQLVLDIELDGRQVGVLNVMVEIPLAHQLDYRINEQHVLHTLISTEFKTWYQTGELRLRYQRPPEGGSA